MRFEPSLPRPRLLESVREAYDLAPAALEFLPVGFGACYRLTAADGARFFLKAWPHLRLGDAVFEVQRASLALSTVLHARVSALGVPAPLTTRDGSLFAGLDGVPLALFPYLEGRAGEPWTRDVRIRLGAASAALHLATPRLPPLSRRETFEVPWEPALRAHLDAALATPLPTRPGIGDVRAWLVARRGEVEAQLARLHGLAAAARAVDVPFVLCHTDLHTNNVLIDPEGGLHLLDWDDARLAPPEHDLWSATWRTEDPALVAAMIEGYRRAGGEAPLHAAHFAFYLLRRHLEDLAVILGQLLDPEADPRDDEARLASLDACAVRWRQLDGDLARLALATGERGAA